MHVSQHRKFAILWVLLGVFLIGCADDGLDRAEVHGQVTVDGQPIEQGSISLVPQPGTEGPAVGTAIEDGTYAFDHSDGPLPGSYRVEIRATRKTGRQIVDDMRPPGDNRVDEVEQYLPPRYNSKSELTVEVARGVNKVKDYDLRLASP
jgi:hypothetical protein